MEVLHRSLVHDLLSRNLVLEIIDEVDDEVDDEAEDEVEVDDEAEVVDELLGLPLISLHLVA